VPCARAAVSHRGLAAPHAHTRQAPQANTGTTRHGRCAGVVGESISFSYLHPGPRQVQTRPPLACLRPRRVCSDHRFWRGEQRCPSSNACMFLRRQRIRACRSDPAPESGAAHAARSPAQGRRRYHVDIYHPSRRARPLHPARSSRCIETSPGRFMQCFFLHLCLACCTRLDPTAPSLLSAPSMARLLFMAAPAAPPMSASGVQSDRTYSCTPT